MKKLCICVVFTNSLIDIPANFDHEIILRVSEVHIYSVYIVTNPQATVLYTGVTNSLCQRLIEHWTSRGKTASFAGKYFCFNLLYYEDFPYIKDAIAREKEIKGWSRSKKVELIKSFNPDWLFLNAAICDGWPPKEIPTVSGNR
ncbi:MAG TPA: GIY-YIG nuclease family protein [Flavitalea sp.]|nr:GIY-YIG nuclease family protein [Flavitalea sp.]